MNGVDWRDLFWTAGGRIPRAPFLLGIGLLFLVSALYEAIGGPFLLITFWFVYPLLWWASACLVAKRLHDRGRSGWWAALVLFGLALVWPHTHGAWTVFGAVVLIWSVVELGLMPGEDGANRFGPSPVAAAA